MCEAKDASELRLNKELLDHSWFSKDELEDERIPVDVRSQALVAFRMYEEIKK